MKEIRKELDGHTKSVSEIIDTACQKMCDSYCKWPNIYENENADESKLYEEQCDHCPLRDLI